MKLYTYKNNQGKIAIIEFFRIYPYNKAAKKQNGFRISIYSEYNNNFLCHVSVHETEAEAKRKLETLSCTNWEEIS